MKTSDTDNKMRTNRDQPTMQSKPQSPMFSVQPDQLPYPYQKRKVNFTTYSGMKSAIPNSVNGYRSQSNTNLPFETNAQLSPDYHSPNIADSSVLQNIGVQSKKIPPVVTSNVHNISYGHNVISARSNEYNTGSGQNAQHSAMDVMDDNGALMWLMAVSKKEAFSQNQSQHNDIMSLTVGNDNQRSPTDHRGLSPQFANDDMEQFSAQPHSAGSRESLSRADVRQEFQEQQYQHPGSPKPNHLRGVTLLSFQGQSTVSPYLDHLTTTNPAMGNAVLAITRLNHGSNPVYLPGAAKAAKGFALINDDHGRPVTGLALKSVRPQPSRAVKSANAQRDEALRNTVPGPIDQVGYGYTPTALERVTAFKARMPDSASTLEARALRVQHNTWGNMSTPSSSKVAKNVQSAHSFNMMSSGRSALQSDGRLSSPSIDLLVSAQRFPNSPVQMTSPTFRFDDGDEPDQFASTVDLGSTASRLQLGASMDRPRTGTPSDVLQGIHKDPLYKVLREECEILRRRPFGATQLVPSTDPASTISPIADGISSTELKALRSFSSLPPAVWITTRIVFFLVMAYLECFLGEEGRESLRAELGMAKIFDVLERQQKTDNIRMETIERLYSWPYFQAILTSPRLFVKALRLIEGGGLVTDHSVGSHLQRPVNFFESYPVERLSHLRELIRHGQGLFQESAVIAVVPVCAKLCSWAKKVIAAIYSACLERIRLDEQLKTLSTVPTNFIEDSVEESPSLAPAQTEKRNKKKQTMTSGATEPNKQTTSSVHNSTSSFSFQNGGRIVAAILPHKLVDAVYSTHSVADTYSVAMTLAQSATSVDLVLLTANGTDNVSVSNSNAHIGLSEMRSHYESQLRERSSSPLHRVTTLSDSRGPSTNLAESSVVSFLQLDAGHQRAGESVILAASRPSEVRVHLHATNSDILVHPLVSHCLSVEVAADLLVVDRIFCRKVGLLKEDEQTGESGSIESHKLRRIEARQLIESGHLASTFSLVLVPPPPSATKTGQFASTPSGEVWSLDEAPFDHMQATGGGFSQTNSYVVCVTESASSWAAFQLARRLAKPSDTVSVVHVPYLDMCDPLGAAADMGCSRQRYDQQRAEAVARIARLTAQYRAVDHNLFVDAVPDYFEVAERAAGYFFQRKSVDRKLRKTPPFTLNSSNLADSYQRNQEKFHLVNRLLAVAQQFEPTFLLLGSDSVDIALGMSTAHETPLNASFPCNSGKSWSGSQSSQSGDAHKTLHNSVAQSFPMQSPQVNALTGSDLLKGDIDDADSVGFIYNDSTVLSNTYDSFDPPARKGSTRASFMSALDMDSNAAVDEERGMYEGDDEGYENDSFVGVDVANDDEDPLYGADSFEGEDLLKPYLMTATEQTPASPGNLSYSASVLPEMTSPLSKLQPEPSIGLTVGELQRSFAEIRAAHAVSSEVVPSAEELAELQCLQNDYMSFKARPVQLVEMLLHTVETGKMKGLDVFSIILTNHQHKNTTLSRRKVI